MMKNPQFFFLSVFYGFMPFGKNKIYSLNSVHATSMLQIQWNKNVSFCKESIDILSYAQCHPKTTCSSDMSQHFHRREKVDSAGHFLRGKNNKIKWGKKDDIKTLFCNRIQWVRDNWSSTWKSLFSNLNKRTIKQERERERKTMKMGTQQASNGLGLS